MLLSKLLFLFCLKRVQENMYMGMQDEPEQNVEKKKPRNAYRRIRTAGDRGRGNLLYSEGDYGMAFHQGLGTH